MYARHGSKMKTDASKLSELFSAALPFRKITKILRD
jgi:hypothetical protein